MKAARHPSGGYLRAHRRDGFTLFQLVLALLALALAGYIAIMEVGRFKHRSQRDQFITDLRQLAAVFETYRSQKGEWPAATNPEVRMPRGMESALAGTPWLTGTPLGGSYDWMPPARVAQADKEPAAAEGGKGAGKKAALGGMIAVTAFAPGAPLALTEEDLRYIDSKLDDGNLATGRFRLGFNGWPVYLVESNP